MVSCDKWVAVKIFEVLFCIACLVCKRVTDDEAVRLNLYLQKLSREWSLLKNITWSSLGSSFGDAIYGGYLIITIGLLLGRIFEEIPRGRRVLEGFLLGLGALFFIILGALELASVDSIPEGLIDNAAVLGVLSLMTAVLFLIDLAGPKKINTSKHCQTDAEKNTLVYPKLPHENKIEINDGDSAKSIEKHKKPLKKSDKLTEKKPETAPTPNDEVDTFITNHKDSYHKFDQKNDDITFEMIEKSKYGSVRNGIVQESLQKSTPHNRTSAQPRDGNYDDDPTKNLAYLKLLEEKNALKQRLDEKEEFIRMREQYLKDYKQNLVLPLDRNQPTDYDRRKWESFDDQLPTYSVKHDYLPELQTPVFSKVKKGNFTSYDNYPHYYKRPESTQTDTIDSKTSTIRSKPATLKQIAEYFGLEQKRANKVEKREAGSQVDRDELPSVSFILPRSRDVRDFNGEPMSPTDPGYVQYTAQNWSDRANRNSVRTPRHSPSEN